MPKRSSSSTQPSPKKMKAIEAASLIETTVKSKRLSRTRNSGPDAELELDSNVDGIDGNSVQSSVESPESVTKIGSKCTKVLNAFEPDSSKLKASFFDFFDEVCALAPSANSDSGVDKARELTMSLQDEEPSERKLIVDQFMRDYLLDKMSIDNWSSWSNFLELGIKLAREDICTPLTPFTLISDLVELSLLKDCQHIFDFVEKRLETWKDPVFLNSGKNAVLRMCNDLLRRLSRAQNTILCGRILIFLANYFPFSERSGLNINSEFNGDNVTVYKTSDGTDDPDDKMDVTEEKNEVLFEGMDISIPGLDKIIVLTQEEKKNKMKVDYNLYVKFWSLQDFFRGPSQCYNKIMWKTFTLYTNDVLTAFNFSKMDMNSKSKSKNKDKKMPEEKISFLKNACMNDIPKLTDESLYFAKYLTNRRLLELQMNDPSFRRYFLIQLLIILQYLTVNVKFKSDGHSLNEEQQDFVKKTMDRVYQLLEDTPPGGKQIVKAVKHVLAREQLWNQWKNDGCNQFKKPVVNTALVADSSRLSEKDDKMDVDDDKGSKLGVKPASKGGKKLDQVDEHIEEVSKLPKKKKRRHLGDIIADAAENNKFLMGNSELTRLWNICGDNLEACRSKARDFTPPIDVFFAEAFKEVDMEPGPLDAKKELPTKKILGNSNFGWRALRLLARKSPYFFQMFGGSPVNPLQNYLEFVLRKILAEKDTPVQPSTPERLEKSRDAKEEAAEEGVSECKKREREDDQDAEMEGEVEEDEEMMHEVRQDSDEDEEEGEVNDKVRNLTDAEMKLLGKNLGDSWKTLALRLRFTKDEVQFFEDTMSKETDNVGTYMLQRWTEQEGDEATVADLLYTLEGLGLKEIGEKVF